MKRRVAISLVSHTNVGKTTLARTLLREDVGTVDDRAHVTDLSEAWTLVEADEWEVLLWDTPRVRQQRAAPQAHATRGRRRRLVPPRGLGPGHRPGALLQSAGGP